MPGTGSERERFDALYGSTYPEMAEYCRRRLPSSSWEDAVAEIYGVAWRKRDTYLSADNPAAWLQAVAFRVVSNEFRKRRRRRRLIEKLLRQDRPEVPPPEAFVEATNEERYALEALSTLKPIEQELVRLVAYEEHSYEEVAAITGLSASAVKTRLYRARQTLTKVYLEKVEGQR
ncbi:MAG: RNA polymerase sigma factor [Actinomycetota bacterium]